MLMEMRRRVFIFAWWVKKTKEPVAFWSLIDAFVN